MPVSLCRKTGGAIVLFAAVLAVTSAGAFAADADVVRDEARPFDAIGYLPNYRGAAVETIPLEHLTEVVYFSLVPDAESLLDHTYIVPEHLERLTERAAEAGAAVTICVGGWDRSAAFASVSGDASTRSRFLEALRDFCLEHGLDGVVFDWEWPADDAEWSRYDRLLHDAARMFGKADLSVSVALAEVIPSQIDAATWQALDQVHLMAYDLPGEHHADADAVARLLRDWIEAAVVEPRQLVLGLPFYGRHTETREAITWAELVAEHDPAPGDTYAGGYAFDGPHAIADKTRLAVERQLGGVMIWELGQDVVDPPHAKSSLLHTVIQQLRRR